MEEAAAAAAVVVDVSVVYVSVRIPALTVI